MASSEFGKAGPAGCTCLRIRKAARLVSQIYDRRLEPAGLTTTQFSLLAHLKAHPGIGVGALAERLVMDPTTLTRNLRPLERRGLVAVEPDPRDRRSRRLSLTGAGQEALLTARPLWERAQRQVRQALGEKETAGLHAALDDVLERLTG